MFSWGLAFICNTYVSLTLYADGISVDWVTNKIYFTDTGLEIVGVFDVENNWYKVLLSTLVGTTVSQPRAIVVDPTTG